MVGLGLIRFIPFIISQYFLASLSIFSSLTSPTSIGDNLYTPVESTITKCAFISADNLEANVLSK